MCFHLKVSYAISLVFSTLSLLFTHTSSSPASFSSAEQAKPKRSPLEIGYVQFTIPATNQHSLHHGVTIHLPSVVLHETNNTTSTSDNLHDPHKQHMLTTTTHVHYRDEWVPGHVVNHVFIPGKVHHVLVPVVTHPVQTVVLHPVHVHHAMLVYRKYYGGFGVGVDYGGRGAGHGYHVL